MTWTLGHSHFGGHNAEDSLFENSAWFLNEPRFMRAVINSLRHTRRSGASKIVKCFCTHIHPPPPTHTQWGKDRERQRNSRRDRNSRDKNFITLTHKSSFNSYFIFFTWFPAVFLTSKLFFCPSKHSPWAVIAASNHGVVTDPSLCPSN